MANNFKRTAHHSLQVDFTSGTRTIQNTPSVTPEPWPPAPPPVGGPYWLANINTSMPAYNQYIYPFFDSVGNIYVNIDLYGRYNTIVKLNSDNASIQWQHTYGNNSTTTHAPVASADTNENVYITTSSSLSGEVDVTCLVKYDNTGTIVWQKETPVYPSGVDFYPMRAVLVNADDTLNVTVSLERASPYYDVVGLGFLTVNSAGTITNQKFYIFPDIDANPTASAQFRVYPHICAVNNENYYTLAGDLYTQDYSTFYGAYVIKYDSDLNIVWSKLLDHTGSEQFYGYAQSTFDNDGNVYVVYSNLTASKIIKLHKNTGEVLWAKEFSELMFVVSGNGTNNVFVFGLLMIYCFDSDGVLLWANEFTVDVANTYISNIKIYDVNTLVVTISNTDYVADPGLYGVYKIPSDGSVGEGSWSLSGATITYAPFIPTVTTSTATTTSFTLDNFEYTFSLNTANIDNSATDFTITEVPF